MGLVIRLEMSILNLEYWVGLGLGCEAKIKKEKSWAKLVGELNGLRTSIHLFKPVGM